MNERQIKETLEKQLQLLSKRSEMCEGDSFLRISNEITKTASLLMLANWYECYAQLTHYAIPHASSPSGNFGPQVFFCCGNPCAEGLRSTDNYGGTG